jgi:hypothetical protein
VFTLFGARGHSARTVPALVFTPKLLYLLDTFKQHQFFGRNLRV